MMVDSRMLLLPSSSCTTSKRERVYYVVIPFFFFSSCFEVVFDFLLLFLLKPFGRVFNVFLQHCGAYYACACMDT